MGNDRRANAVPVLLWTLTAAIALIGCGQPAPAADGPSTATGGPTATGIAAAPFEDATQATGLAFTHVSGRAGDMTLLEMMGSGGGWLDYDNDGDLDAFLVQGHALPPVDEAAAPIPPPPADAPLDRLFRNDLSIAPDGTRTLRFTDVTDASGIRATGYGMGVATGDYDNDGWVDLYVTSWGPNQLWRNNGDGTFTDATAAAGVDDPAWSTSAAFVDYDRDGWLDLVVANYVDFTLATHRPCVSQTAGRVDYCGPLSYNPVPDRLFRNRGDGTFADATVEAGLPAAFGPGLGVIAFDANGDGWHDILVANDTQENQLWINQGGTRFADEARTRGVAVNRSGLPEAGMGIVADDLTGDGIDDVFITHINRETNTLFAGSAAGVFEDQTRASGLGAPSWLFTGFGVAALDYDGDGQRDLFTTNGDVHILLEQLQAGDPVPLKQTNQLYHGLGAGRFEDAGATAGAPFATPLIGRGLAAGDADNDGDTDVLVTQNEGPAHLYLNISAAAGPWLGLRLVGGTPPRDQLGARAALVHPSGTVRVGRAHADGSYLSAGDPRVLFSLGSEPAIAAVRVTWPSGEVEQWAGLEPGRYHTLVKSTGSPAAAP